jgi:DNA-directed RNA polymerase specialized sigma24 family protein
LARARAGDRLALARLVRRYQQRLAGYLWALGVPRADLEPLLVEAFSLSVSVSVAAHREPPDRGPARAALYAIATRLALQHGLPQRRCLLVLCCLEGFSYAEVAEMLGLSTAAVRATVRRAKAALDSARGWHGMRSRRRATHAGARRATSDQDQGTTAAEPREPV